MTLQRWLRSEIWKLRHREQVTELRTLPAALDEWPRVLRVETDEVQVSEAIFGTRSYWIVAASGDVIAWHDPVGITEPARLRTALRAGCWRGNHPDAETALVATASSDGTLYFQDAYDIRTQQFLGFDDASFLFGSKLHVEMVPALYRGPWTPHDTLLAKVLAGGPSLIGPGPRTGCIIRLTTERFDKCGRVRLYKAAP